MEDLSPLGLDGFTKCTHTHTHIGAVFPTCIFLGQQLTAGLVCTCATEVRHGRELAAKDAQILRFQCYVEDVIAKMTRLAASQQQPAQ